MEIASPGTIDDERIEKLFKLIDALLAVGGEANAGLFQMRLTDATGEPLSGSHNAADSASIASVANNVLARLIQEPSISFQQSGHAFVALLIGVTPTAANNLCETARQAIVQDLKSQHNISNVGVMVDVTPIDRETFRRAPEVWLPQYGGQAQPAVSLGGFEQLSRPDALHAGIELVMNPVWTAALRPTPIYVAQMRRRLSTGEFSYGYSVRAEQNSLRMMAYFDQQLITYAADIIAMQSKSRSRTAIVTPIYYRAYNFSNLAPIYHALLRSIPNKTKELLLLDIIGGGDVYLSETLRWDVNTIKKYCRGVVLHLDSNAQQIPKLQGTEMTAIGTTAYNITSRDTRGLQRLQRFIAATDKLDRPRFLTGVRRKSLAEAALKLGFEYVSGPFIDEDLFVRPLESPTGDPAPGH